MSKTVLKCTTTHGRWNKGDIAGFEPEKAKMMTEGKSPKWKKATAKEAKGDE